MIDRTGKKFGKLTVLFRYYKPDGKTTQRWGVICDCGNKCDVSSTTLRRSNPKCPNCVKEYRRKVASEMCKKRIGEKHPNWNFDLSEKKRNISRTRMAPVREAVFERDNYTCRRCGNRGTILNAHHIEPWYSNKELRYEYSNLITLCDTCHKEYHSAYRRDNINNVTLKEFIENV